MTKNIYRFGMGATEGDAKMRDHLGGKGANLAEMAAAGLPVPPGFTISTGVCARAIERNGELPDDVVPELDAAVRWLESAMEARLGDVERPLLVSVRSGAAVSMPGMMDTVLNLGMNDDVALGLARDPARARWTWDSYRRFIQMFGTVVMGLSSHPFEAALDAKKRERGVTSDQALDADDLHDVTNRMKAVYRQATGRMFPTDPREQLGRAVAAVFRSWNSERAIKYREVQRIRGLLGTAVNVQAMVFGNRGKTSGTGVCFTRNPATGEKVLYGEYLVDAQGEDVVAGTRTPEPIARLAEDMPAVHAELVRLASLLEARFRNVQDIEFTVQEGKLFLLQTRHGKRTGAAALKIAVDLVAEGVVSADEAVLHLVEPAHIDQMLHPHFADEEGYRRAGRVLAKGLPASPGAAVGKLVFSAEDAEAAKARGERVVLARIETSPEDVGGMHAAEGIVTTRGGMTSHAAVVARGWGKPCVAGCAGLVIDYASRTMTNGRVTVKEGELVSLNGSSGEVIRGQEVLADAQVSPDFTQFMGWVDAARRLRVRANADTPRDAAVARSLGAEGIGLCRTEHMFFDPERLLAMREMILASDGEGRRRALAQILPFQREDFRGIFRAMAGLPVTIRLLDPPLHEFLPKEPAQVAQVATALGVTPHRVEQRVRALEEQNPMLGHRGCRLGITHPEITEMQARAIIEAAASLVREGVDVRPEIMVPLVIDRAELVDQAALIRRVAAEVSAETGVAVEFTVGTMIETPRAALVAGDIAEEAQFFSFGTNDLTQMTLGISRDDVSGFLPHYLSARLLPEDPFQSIDVPGVGQLVRRAVDAARLVRPTLKLGVCGEHGGDPKSVAFFEGVGLDYVSCSPLRVPVARIAAAQAALARRGGTRAKDGEA
jgi:pyruvate,orthophosphate dikinase